MRKAFIARGAKMVSEFVCGIDAAENTRSRRFPFTSSE